METFINESKKLVVNKTNSLLDAAEGKKIDIGDVYVVWACKTLQNAKALLSTTNSDGMYYEATYNGDKQEIYLDSYKKIENECVSKKINF